MITTQEIDPLSIVVIYAVITRSENGHPIDIEVKKMYLGFYAGSSWRSRFSQSGDYII